MNCNRAHSTTIALAAAMIVTLSALTGCGPNDQPDPVPLPSPTGTKQPISKANLVHLWPLTIDHGTITCHTDGDAVNPVFVAPDGTGYALNDHAERNGYPRIDPLLRPDAHLGAIRSLALKLCPSS